MRISIYDAVSIPVLLLAIVLAVAVLYGLQKRGIIRSFFDPAILMLFQVSFTFFILLGTGLMSVEILVSYCALWAGIVMFRRVTLFHGEFASEDDWFKVLKVLIIVSLVTNVVLLSTKGFILFKANPQVEKLQFFQNAGLFKRINDITAPLCGIMTIYLFVQKKKIQGALLAVYTAFLLLSSGSKSGLLGVMLFIGTYMHYYPIVVKKRLMATLAVGAVLSVLVVFQISYGTRAWEGVYRRFVAFADGPFYFYNGKLGAQISYPVDYPVDQLLVNTRVTDDLRYRSLGPNIIKHYFGSFDPLMGPNPQFIVEGETVFKEFFFVYCFLIGALFMLLRNSASNPFSFILLSIIFTPLLLDIQYTLANLVTVGLIAPLLLLIKFLKSINNPAGKPSTDGQ